MISELPNKEGTCKESGFSYIHSSSRNDRIAVPHIDNDLFSVFLLLEGDLDYVIEGKRLHIDPRDVVLVSNNELHHSILKDGSSCDYILLMLDLDFFIKNSCTSFVDMVFHRIPGTNNIIPAEIVQKSGIYDICMRLDHYIQEKPVCLPVVKSVIVELLYNLNRQVRMPERNNYQSESIRQIIAYIDANITRQLSLDAIARTFFLTKQHLCKTFKKNTGFTVGRYICYRRIVLVQELYARGMTISEACMEAGFSSYSSFYRSYRGMMNAPPRKSLNDSREK